MKNSEGSMDFMGVNAVLENNPLYVNKDMFAFIELLTNQIMKLLKLRERN